MFTLLISLALTNSFAATSETCDELLNMTPRAFPVLSKNWTWHAEIPDSEYIRVAELKECWRQFIIESMGPNARANAASSSDSLSDEEAIDLLLELIMFVVDTIDETIDNITISIDNLAAVSNAHSSLLETMTADIYTLNQYMDSLGNTTNHNSEVINDNFDSVKYWFIIVGVVSFFLFLATWIAIIVLFCRDPMRGWRGAEARPMTSYSN